MSSKEIRAKVHKVHIFHCVSVFVIRMTLAHSLSPSLSLRQPFLYQSGCIILYTRNIFYCNFFFMDYCFHLNVYTLLLCVPHKVRTESNETERKKNLRMCTFSLSVSLCLAIQLDWFLSSSLLRTMQFISYGLCVWLITKANTCYLVPKILTSYCCLFLCWHK